MRIDAGGMRRWGFSRSDILIFARKYPDGLELSEDSIRELVGVRFDFRSLANWLFISNPEKLVDYIRVATETQMVYVDRVVEAEQNRDLAIDEARATKESAYAVVRSLFVGGKHASRLPEDWRVADAAYLRARDAARKAFSVSIAASVKARDAALAEQLIARGGLVY